MSNADADGRAAAAAQSPQQTVVHYVAAGAVLLLGLAVLGLGVRATALQLTSTATAETGGDAAAAAAVGDPAPSAPAPAATSPGTNATPAEPDGEGWYPISAISPQGECWIEPCVRFEVERATDCFDTEVTVERDGSAVADTRQQVGGFAAGESRVVELHGLPGDLRSELTALPSTELEDGNGLDVELDCRSA